MMSTRGSMHVRSLTAGDGPFLVGIASKSLTLVQLEEYLETNGPVFEEDTNNVERATRGKNIRTLGTIVPQGSGQCGALWLDNKSLAGLRFSEESAGWNNWVYNLGPAMTTGSTFGIALQHFVRWAQ